MESKSKTDRKTKLGGSKNSPAGKVAGRRARSPAARRPAASLPYVPTTKENEAIEAYQARTEQRPLRPRLKVIGNALALDHPDQSTASKLLAASLGDLDQAALTGLLTQLLNAVTKGQNLDGGTVNAALALAQGIAPRDTVEAMLAAQMVAIHDLTMNMARRLNNIETVPQQDSASNALNKLARTFAAQVEALNRHRGKGQQAIRVEHVTVNAGGRAIVGNVTPGAGVAAQLEEQPDAQQLALSHLTALPCQDQTRDAVPVAQGQGPTPLQDARLR